ncbi:hypothetical protein G6031_12875, partial [Dietzia sp. CQ4]|nr:hypothetical protein [Dietzia sp. CQ4]
MAVAASVVTPLAVYGADHLVESGDDIAATAGAAVPTGTAEVSLSDAPAAAGVDTDIAVGSAPVKEVTSETPFSMVGVTWKGYNPQAVAALRAKNPDGSWGPWYEAESVDDEGESTTGSGGTEPVFLGVDTTTVQIKVSGVDIADTSLADAPEGAESRDAESGSAESQGAEATAAPESEAADTPATGSPAQNDVAATRSA